MSSTLRTVAQIPARVKYLVCVSSTNDATSGLLDTSCYSFTCDEGTFPESVISSANLPTVTGQNVTVGQLFKDLGRQVVICNATTDLHQVVYREVQLVDDDGSGHEGVPGDYTTARFVRVWSEDGAGVRVARLGPGAH